MCFLDVKRLAEKEDWVVDNEGLTSLVHVLYFYHILPSLFHSKNVKIKNLRIHGVSVSAGPV